MLSAQAVALGAWLGALGEIPLPLCPRLFVFKMMFSECFPFCPDSISGECEGPTLLGLGRGADLSVGWGGSYRCWAVGVGPRGLQVR